MTSEELGENLKVTLQTCALKDFRLVDEDQAECQLCAEGSGNFLIIVFFKCYGRTIPEVNFKAIM